jgi:glycosyltransferase involved in cell wall biosynthesis
MSTQAIKNSSLLSILMPAYNAEKYIAQSINSLIQQDYENFELLIYNDASTDGTIGEILKFSDSRIKVFTGEINVGAAQARNVLLSKANGDFIAFFDSDDLCLKQKFTHNISYLNRKPEIDLVGSKIFYINEKSKTIFLIKSFESFVFNDIEADLFFNNTLSTSSIVFKKRILPLISFDSKFEPAEDYELFARISGLIKIENIDKRLVKYRVCSSSLSFTKRDKIKDTLDFIHRRFFLDNLRFNITSDLLEVHNKFLYSNEINLSYLDESINLYNQIIDQNKSYNVYQAKSLLKAIRKNWFLKCMYCSKNSGILAINYYLTRFSFHNYTSVKYFFYLAGSYLKNILKSLV